MSYITAYPLTQRINPMRKRVPTAAAVAGEPFFGTFADERDGQTYRPPRGT